MWNAVLKAAAFTSSARAAECQPVCIRSLRLWMRMGLQCGLLCDTGLPGSTEVPEQDVEKEGSLLTATSNQM